MYLPLISLSVSFFVHYKTPQFMIFILYHKLRCLNSSLSTVCDAQKERLENEGVVVDGDKVDLKKYLWK